MAVEKENSSIILDIFTSRNLVQLQVLYGMENVRKNELVFGKVNKKQVIILILILFFHTFPGLFSWHPTLMAIAVSTTIHTSRSIKYKNTSTCTNIYL